MDPRVFVVSKQTMHVIDEEFVRTAEKCDMVWGVVIATKETENLISMNENSSVLFMKLQMIYWWTFYYRKEKPNFFWGQCWVKSIPSPYIFIKLTEKTYRLKKLIWASFWIFVICTSKRYGFYESTIFTLQIAPVLLFVVNKTVWLFWVIPTKLALHCR